MRCRQTYYFGVATVTPSCQTRLTVIEVHHAQKSQAAAELTITMLSMTSSIGRGRMDRAPSCLLRDVEPAMTQIADLVLSRMPSRAKRRETKASIMITTKSIAQRTRKSRKGECHEVSMSYTYPWRTALRSLAQWVQDLSLEVEIK